jgi:predicted dehydrogenase/MoaA/NifB/PqqE/SkfB family radical SAM enzyme
VLRGNAPLSPHFHTVLEVAARARWEEVWLRAPGDRFVTLDAAVDLHARGVRGVILPVFSQVPAVHDRIAGRAGALVDVLRAARALGAAGISVSVETPLLAPRLQDLAAVVELAHRAAPGLAGARFYVPARPQPAVIAPPPWDVAAASLRAGLAACEARKVPVALHEFDGVPLCVLGHDEALQRVYRINPTRRVARRPGASLGADCARCAVRDHCHGVSDGYRAANGEVGLAPFAAKPRKIFEQRTTPRREWTDAQRRAASLVVNRVLRPTVHCNQDCPFCSANETTENVFKRPEDMYRRIARMARSGVRYMSFSGGEPALSKDLVHYIRAASRLGVKDIELVTNGALLDAPEKVRPLREAGLTKAFVSLHAHDEALSRRSTAKIGDWAKTVRCIDAMLEAGVRVSVNHVITALNYPYLPRFAELVSARWGGAVEVSFAFVTPQYRALENLALVPRISEVMPYLRRAMRLLQERGSGFVVGSRQGIPPCFLGEFTAWSDFVEMSPQAHADDAPQKVRGPGCDRCRFSAQCVGLWRHYAARYGFDELTPVEGVPLTPEQLQVLSVHSPPRRFDEAHEALRYPPREDPPLPEEPPIPRAARRLPVLAPARALRVALLGSGSHAQRLARAMANVPGMTLAGVASPHLLDRDPGPFAAVPRERDAAALLDALRPDAAVVAAATLAHHDLAALCAQRGIPCLVEKPLAFTAAQADAMVALGEGALVMPAHAMRFAPGVVALREVLAAGTFGRVLRARCTKRFVSGGVEAPSTWSRDALYQVLYHAVYLLGVVTGTCAPEVLRVDARGAHRPETVRATLRAPGGVDAEVLLDFTGTSPFDELAAFGEHGRRLAWQREDAQESLVHDTPSGDRTTSVDRGSDAEGMLAAFRDAVLARGPSPIPTADGRDAMRTAQAIVDGLGAFLARPNAPKHVASPAMRGR